MVQQVLGGGRVEAGVHQLAEGGDVRGLMEPHVEQPDPRVLRALGDVRDDHLGVPQRRVVSRRPGLLVCHLGDPFHLGRDRDLPVQAAGQASTRWPRAYAFSSGRCTR